jgi:hypothetical protein
MTAKRDPFIDLEEEIEKTFHIIQSATAEHRSLLAQVPELKRAPGGPVATGVNSGHLRPAELQWVAAEHAVLRSLDRLCAEVTLELLPDVAEDVQLLRAIVEKNVQGGSAVSESSGGAGGAGGAGAGGAGGGGGGGDDVLSGDEVARRVAAVHRFERTLSRAKSDAADMIKFREYRQMQIAPEVYGDFNDYDDNGSGTSGSPGAATDARYLTPAAQRGGRFTSPSPAIKIPGAAAAAAAADANPSGPPRANDYAASFVAQELAEQDRVSAQHGELLAQIHVGVISADQKAKMINAQIAESRAKLSYVEKSMETIQGKLDSAIHATNKLLEQASDKQKLALIGCLMTVLVLLIFGLLQGNGSRTTVVVTKN